jgi:hypothetical protein
MFKKNNDSNTGQVHDVNQCYKKNDRETIGKRS